MGVSSISVLFALSALQWWSYTTCDVIRKSFMEEGPEYCSVILSRAIKRKVKADEVPDLRGTWVSSRCETRPGPEYAVRSYSFQDDGAFRLLLHTYEDASCSQPAMSFVAVGNLTLGAKSWVSPGGTEAEYVLRKVTVWPHSKKAAFKLSLAVNATCPGRVKKIWRRRLSYTLLSFQMSPNEVMEDTDCDWRSWNELQLLKVELRRPHKGIDLRQYKSPHSGKRRQAIRELFLGDLNSDPAHQMSYRPTAYQDPLRHILPPGQCSFCKAVAKSTEQTPPTFSVLHSLPLIPEGSWASPMCEIQPHGMFLTREIHLSSSKGRWTARQDYFKDPFCRKPIFTLTAAGSYTPVSPKPQGYNFEVRTMSLTPKDDAVVNALNHYRGGRCGRTGDWRLGVSQDVALSGGCEAIGVRVPKVEKEILKIERDEGNNLILFLGQASAWTDDYSEKNASRPTSWGVRPTSWGAPLQQCTPNPEENSILPAVGAQKAAAAKLPRLSFEVPILFISLALM